MRGYADGGRLARLVRSSIGAKFLVAVTGLLLLGFLLTHLSGNLLVFAGAARMNAYAQWLADQGPLLWVARIGLLVVFVLHVLMALKLNLANRQARPVRYSREATQVASWSSRYMILTGLLVLAYLLYHLAHFTLHWIDTGGMGLTDLDGNKDVYRMLVLGLRKPMVAFLYVAANALLGLHLWHGIGSLFQTLGCDHPALNPVARVIARGLPPLIALGYISIPVSIWLGIVSIS